VTTLTHRHFALWRETCLPPPLSEVVNLSRRGQFVPYQNHASPRRRCGANVAENSAVDGVFHQKK